MEEEAVVSDEEMNTDESSEEEIATAAEVLDKIEKLWLNEKCAPELLVPASEEVEVMLEQIRTMLDNITKLPKGDSRILPHKLEVLRIKYLVSSYLRTRMAKLHQFAWYANDQELKRTGDQESKLTSEEFKFLREYLKLLEGHLSTVGLAHMPKNINSLQPTKIMSMPNMDSFVFFRVLKDNFLAYDDAVEGRKERDLKEGEQYLMRYGVIAHLVAAEAVQLI